MLKKGFIVFLFGVLYTSLFSQTIEHEARLIWDKTEHTEKEFSTGALIPGFQGALYHGKYGILPFYHYEIPVNDKVKAIDVELKNQQYQLLVLSPEQISSPAYKDISNVIQIRTGFKTENGQRIAQIDFIPIEKDAVLDTYKRLISFGLEIKLTEAAEKQQLVGIDFASESVMTDGDWYKFSVDASGVYKLTGADLQSAGISLSGLASDNISVYGFGGMLNEENSDFRYPDIPELAIRVVDGNDGVFDASDYLLFYAQGPDTWKFNENKSVFEHQLNIYNRKAYYFVHIGQGNGKRIATPALPETAAGESFNTFTDYAFVEDETYNLIGSGRRWVGDKFEFTDNRSYAFSFNGLVVGSAAYIRAELVARSTVASSFSMLYNGTNLGNTLISQIPTGSYPAYAYDNTFETYFDLEDGGEVVLDLKYNRPLSGSVGWLDFIEVNVERELKFSQKQLLFRCPQSIENEVSQFEVANATNAVIWDITELSQVENIAYDMQGSNATFRANTNVLREYVAFTPDMAYTPSFIEQIENQNLHAISNVDMLIVSPQLFVGQANELADFHRNDGLTVEVITLDKIYNEFSSGSQDVTAIRDFVRAVYSQSSEATPLKYLLLFGDASYDYLDRVENNTNLVPTYESYESFDPIISIAIDDYFAFLDPNEGDMYYDDVDIGVGRLPVATVEEANDAVAKIKRYASAGEEVLGDWRNVVCFVADDEDYNLHIRQANDLANMVDTIFPAGNLDKIYVDAYQQEFTPAGQRYPDVNEAINQRVEKGALILSYTGHGGETGWGQERYLDMTDIETWTNKNKLPVFLTATCEFARYDDPERVSAGEYIFLKNDGGGIALFTTSRATYAGSNYVISRNFYNKALYHPDLQYLRMGDILKLTKRASGSGFNVMKFVLLGDPALKLSLPENYLSITEINQNNTLANDTLKALSYISIQGEVQSASGSLLSDFNGHIYPTVFDKMSEITTLANDYDSDPFSFYLQKNMLYKGKAEVKNGLFEFDFVVPKDIAYNYGKGKISLYAVGENTDAAGYNRSIIVGGYDNNSVQDTEGPQIALYMNDQNFVDGGMTNENPVLLAVLSDENGINTIGNGIGHDITALLDEDNASLKILNDYYEADVNTFQQGTVRYPFYNLSEGEHELTFKVWDIYNNSSTATLRFLVSPSANLAIDAIMNYPNPFYDQTTFSFEQNASSQQLYLNIDIFSLDGKLVKHIENTFSPYSSRVNHVQWDGTDQHGSKIMKGMYIYRLKLTTEEGESVSKTAKLVYLK